ncbi:MAG: hypothetical protein LWX01_05395 [Deltaproteobacteria bacterium]|nr:hypothetical protein [Deltaproteobacteria bacterium]
MIEKPEHTFKYTLNLKWNDYSLIHYLRKLKESKGDAAYSVQGSSGFRNGAKRKKHWNRFRAELILSCIPGKKRFRSVLPDRKRARLSE